MPRRPRNVQPPYAAGTAPNYTDSSLCLHVRGLDSQPCRTLATCWKLTPLTNGTPDVTKAVGATSHTRDLTLPGHGALVFKSNQGIVPSAVDAEAGGNSGGVDVNTIFDGLYLTEEMVEAGELDGAMFEVFIVNYKAVGMGEYVQFKGFVGKIQSEGLSLKAEGTPLTSIGDVPVGRTMYAKCDAVEFADLHGANRCKLDPAGNSPGGLPRTVTGTVTTGGSAEIFYDTARAEPDGRFTHGVVTWLTGANAGRKSEVKLHVLATRKFTLQRALPSLIQTGDTYSMLKGCRRDVPACEEEENIINYRGYPYSAPPEQVAKVNRPGN
ncbi:MAG: hypothetical protein QOG00_271 [Pyrinomonadaceae bacterium]|nr:hypothetical protein [Pyrinomonadaceae bacterium]